MKRSILFTACLLVTGATSITMLTVSSAEAQLGPMGISNDGVIFPDGSLQKTAASPQAIYAIGGTGPADGFVFHVTADGLHGLEAARSDQTTGAVWGCWGSDLIPATANTSLGTGASNTDDIIRGCTELGIPAALAADYVSPSGYFDWYLPSKDELDLMWNKIGQGNTEEPDVPYNVGGFANGYYWSSSEVDDNFAWRQYFYDGSQDDLHKYSSSRVRAVRAF